MNLLELRQMLCSTELDDQELCTPSLIAGVDITIPSLSYFPDKHWNGAYIYIYEGTGAGQERKVINQVGGVFTVNYAWTTLPDVTSRFEIHKQYSTDKITQSIKRAQQSVKNRCWLPYTDAGQVMTSAVSYTIPALYVYIDTVYSVDSLGNRVELFDWYIDRANRKIVLKSPVDGNTLVLQGSKRVPDLVDDSSTIELNIDYLILKSCAYLKRSHSAGPQTDPDNNMQNSLVYEQEALRVLQRTPQKLPANSRSVE